MSEGLSGVEAYNANQAVWERDMANPERGRTIKMVKAVVHEAASKNDFDDPLYVDFYALQQSFRGQFATTDEALRYRLYHVAIGSSPEGDLFDTEGENSLENGFRKLAETYNIKID